MIWNDLQQLIFPVLCHICREPLLRGEEHICLQCFYKLPRIRFIQPGHSPTEQLFTGKFPFEFAAAFLHYKKKEAGQKLIHALKYRNQRELGFYLGKIASQELKLHETCENIDLIVPVPLHPKRLKERGYNQAEWIARGIASVFPKPVDSKTLQRIKTTKSQTRKSVYERWENVQNTFHLTNTPYFEGKHILLVDDVITTGSTLGASAQTVLEASNARVSLFAIAIA